MFSKMISAVLLTALAGRVLAQTPPPPQSPPPPQFDFNITVGVNTFLAIDALNFTKEPSFSTVPSLSQCNDCATAQTAIAACSSNDTKYTQCFCNTPVTNPLQACQECLFTALITVNKPAPEVRIGSNPFLGAWATKCVNITNDLGVKPIALAVTVPPSWDGPFVAVFPDAIGWVLAVTGGILGSSLIFMLCNM